MKSLNLDDITYSKLYKEINQSRYVKLTHKNYVYDTGDSISISEDNKVIDSNCAVIDIQNQLFEHFMYLLVM